MRPGPRPHVPEPPAAPPPRSRDAVMAGIATARDSNASPRVDPDFARDVLGDLYAYRSKRMGFAWLLWALVGWAGGHRFYMERPVTGLLMLLTGGGALVWWVVDAFLLNRMLRDRDAEQARRRREGLPPLELSFMPPLAADVLTQPPPWTVAWHERPAGRRALRLAGDVLVLLIAGQVLGALAGAPGGEEAIFAAAAVIGVTLLGGRVGRLDEIPVARGLIRWSHRLRLFYYYRYPGSPLALLFRGPVGILLAPFRRHARAEARLYIEIGAVFTLAFLILDLAQEVAAPVAEMGLAAFAPPRLLALWLREAMATFLLIYACVAPIGAILTLHLLTRRTHLLSRILGAVALLGIAIGLT